MSNPNFAPLFSTNEIYRDTDNTICLTDDLDAIEAAIEDLQGDIVDPTQFAAANHTHSGYAAAGHTHDDLYISKDLQFTNDSGGVEYYYGETSGKNLLDEIAGWPQGIHTAYSNGAVVGNPKNNESWRIIAHKTSTTIGWVMAYGTSGSVYSNYYDSGWKGWRCIYDVLSAPLWTGEMYMSANQEITPSKALSDCAHGWLLLWSDYNPGEGVNNSDFATTMISKFSHIGQTWNGARWLCPVPRYANDADSGEAQIIKVLYVHDTKIVGNAANAIAPRNDVVLRAVYEF